ncbi:MAG: HAD-IB family hydrolase [Burkholderiaceae bacterium]|nr:HAD-IB family hydrolase [Burkholderiaceae bacterium]
MMQLALFDLDHTLLPLDSDYEWGRFLVSVGAVDEERYRSENERFYREYRDGTLDISEFLAFGLAPLAQHTTEKLESWRARFVEEVITPAVRPAARRLVREHRDAGDLCAIVTATNEFVTAPIARAFGVEHLIATQVEQVDGQFTGKPAGTPSYREGKVLRTTLWLESQSLGWESISRSWCYSDSSNDLPLMLRVTDPVATNPDEKLAEYARERGWPVLRLFE